MGIGWALGLRARLSAVLSPFSAIIILRSNTNYQAIECVVSGLRCLLWLEKGLLGRAASLQEGSSSKVRMRFTWAEVQRLSFLRSPLFSLSLLSLRLEKSCS